MNNANLINQTSGDFEYYTPEPWPSLARKLFGEIDLDPASNLIANQRIQATQFFTEADNGLVHPWNGRVFMNHPFHRGEKACPKDRARCVKKACEKRGHHIDEDIPGNSVWINKLIDEYQSGRTKEAIVVCFCSSSETWFYPLLSYPQLFPKGRIDDERPDGSKARGVTKGSVITYLGDNLDGFADIFGPFGTIKLLG